MILCCQYVLLADLVGGQPIVCSKTMLEMIFNEPQLLIVFRVALEIEMVYAPTLEEREDLRRLTVEDMISIEEGETLIKDNQNNNVHNHEGTFNSEV